MKNGGVVDASQASVTSKVNKNTNSKEFEISSKNPKENDATWVGFVMKPVDGASDITTAVYNKDGKLVGQPMKQPVPEGADQADVILPTPTNGHHMRVVVTPKSANKPVTAEIASVIGCITPIDEGLYFCLIS